MMKRLVKAAALAVVAMSAISTPALATFHYTVMLVNQTGEMLAVECGANNVVIPLASGGSQTRQVGPAEDGEHFECRGYDHHGAVITSGRVIADHHTAAQRIVLVRGSHGH